jgi:hypothetical protein
MGIVVRLACRVVEVGDGRRRLPLSSCGESCRQVGDVACSSRWACSSGWHVVSLRLVIGVVDCCRHRVGSHDMAATCHLV